MADYKSFDGGKTKWKTQSYKASEWDVKNNCPVSKPGGAKRDLAKEGEDYRDGWDRIFGRKEAPDDRNEEAADGSESRSPGIFGKTA